MRVGATDIRVTMSERAIALDQVVVTGTAGGEQRRALGTSVAAVDASDIMAKAAVPSIDGLLNGRAPGVVILPQTGQAGAGAQVRIRGYGTFSLSNNPLLFVDGIRANNGSDGIITRLNDFDPEEIETIEVLKGPAAATLYGTEAARGVINVITKKGAAGGTKYAFSVKARRQLVHGRRESDPVQLLLGGDDVHVSHERRGLHAVQREHGQERGRAGYAAVS